MGRGRGERERERDIKREKELLCSTRRFSDSSLIRLSVGSAKLWPSGFVPPPLYRTISQDTKAEGQRVPAARLLATVTEYSESLALHMLIGNDTKTCVIARGRTPERCHNCLVNPYALALSKEFQLSSQPSPTRSL